MIEAADKAGLFITGSARVTPPRATTETVRKIVLIATEESGDRLGANLMKVLRQRLGDAVQFEGVGGRAMAREGLTSRFPIEELSIIGLAAVVRQLPKILRRIKQTAAAVTEAAPDILVIIDSPDFTHRVAKRVRASAIRKFRSSTTSRRRSGRGGRAGRARCCPISITCWRCCRSSRRPISGCAGPPCSYVGHPLTEQIGQLRPNAEEQTAARSGAAGAAGAAGQPPQRDPPPHDDVRRRRWPGCRQRGVAFEAMLPTMPHLQEAVMEAAEDLEGAAPRRDRRAGEARRVPDRACGAGQIRHRDAGTGAVRRADGDGLSDRRDGSLHLAAGDQGEFGDPGQSRDRRKRHPGIPAAGLHAGKAGSRRCAKCSADPTQRRKQVEAFAKIDRSCRPATSRRASAPPISFWRRCGKRGGSASACRRRSLPATPAADPSDRTTSRIRSPDMHLRAARVIGVSRHPMPQQDVAGAGALGDDVRSALRAEIALLAGRGLESPEQVLALGPAKAVARDVGHRRERRAVRLAAGGAVAMHDDAGIGVHFVGHAFAQAASGQHRVSWESVCVSEAKRRSDRSLRARWMLRIARN